MANQMNDPNDQRPEQNRPTSPGRDDQNRGQQFRDRDQPASGQRQKQDDMDRDRTNRNRDSGHQ